MANHKNNKNNRKNGKRSNGATNGRNGRPRIEIDWQVFENLCAIQCTLEEIALALGVSPDTIERRCKENYNTTFAEVFKQKRGRGFISLRRTMYQMAVGDEDKKIPPNATMLIWLSKNWLGYKDKVEHESTTPIPIEIVGCDLGKYPKAK